MINRLFLHGKADWHFTVGAALLISVMANMPVIDMALRKPLEPAHDVFQLHNLPPMFTWWSLFLQLLIVFFFGMVLIRFLRSHLWIGSQSFFFTWSTFLVTSIFTGVYFFLMWAVVSLSVHHPSWVFSTVATRGVLVLAACILLTNYLKVQAHREKIMNENKALKELDLQNQIEVLRNQLNPHFLFNTLNTLSYLINTDQSKSQQFLTNLAYVLRTSVDLQQNNQIPLSEDIKLAEAYVYLLSMRFGGLVNLQIDGAVPSGAGLPPMTLLVLIENAVKHNVITSNAPLLILVEYHAATCELVVSNNLQPKSETGKGGIGLRNLDERFKRLAGKGVSVACTEGRFVVSIPLMKTLCQPA